jgi:hypothetical protein
MVRGDAIASDLTASKPKRVRGAASDSETTQKGIWVVSQSARPAATGQHLSLSSALDDVIARRRNLCHQLLGISSVSQGNVLLAPIIGWILYAPKYLLGDVGWGNRTDHRRLRRCFGAAQLARRQLLGSGGLSILRQPRRKRSASECEGA